MSRHSSVDGVDLVFPKDQVNDLFKAMETGVRELNWSMGKGIQKVAWSIARSLGTSTKIAPKKRDVKLDEQDAQKRKKAETSDRNLARRGMSDARSKSKEPLWITKSKKGNEIKFRAKNKREANRSPFVVIANRGLASASWMLGARKLGAGGSTAGVSQSAKYYAMKHIDIRKNLRGGDPHVIINNRINYIRDALKGSGTHAVNSAMERAAGSLMHEIENTLRKKMGLGRE